ncbi:MAG: hypothetical protein IT457_24770 [Planctomycetes bacterium]|nr:hypothetical protein [Planctomycetota bacterium]
MHFVSRLCSLAVLSGLSFAPLAAQEVSGLVVCDPITVTFNYRFDLRGRAGEIGVLLVSPMLSPAGSLNVPGIGTLFLHPDVILQAAAMPLNAQGQASITMTPPMNELGLVAQVAFLVV